MSRFPKMGDPLTENQLLKEIIEAHGGQILYGEFVLRSGKISPLMIDWTKCKKVDDE